MRKTRIARYETDNSEASLDFDHAKLLVVADTHGYIDSRIVDLSRTCDIAIHAGDILATQVLDELRPQRGKVYAIKGNNDSTKT